MNTQSAPDSDEDVVVIYKKKMDWLACPKCGKPHPVTEPCPTCEEGGSLKDTTPKK